MLDAVMTLKQWATGAFLATVIAVLAGSFVGAPFGAPYGGMSLDLFFGDPPYGSYVVAASVLLGYSAARRAPGLARLRKGAIIAGSIALCAFMGLAGGGVLSAAPIWLLAAASGVSGLVGQAVWLGVDALSLGRSDEAEMSSELPAAAPRRHAARDQAVRAKRRRSSHQPAIIRKKRRR